MLPVILIVVGAILTLLGLAGFIALMIEPFYRALRVVFAREDDYVYYETKPGRALLKREVSALRNGFALLLVCGIICLAAGLFLKYSPSGFDSLFSKNTEQGVESGEAQTDEEDIEDSDETAQDIMDETTEEASGVIEDPAGDEDSAGEDAAAGDEDAAGGNADESAEGEDGAVSGEEEPAADDDIRSEEDIKELPEDGKTAETDAAETEAAEPEVAEPEFVGPYVDSLGHEHNYYITITGNEVCFNGETCADLNELERKISDFGRINSIYIVDDFAVSATYHGVMELLDRYGMTYETGE